MLRHTSTFYPAHTHEMHKGLMRIRSVAEIIRGPEGYRCGGKGKGKNASAARAEWARRQRTDPWPMPGDVLAVAQLVRDKDRFALWPPGGGKGGSEEPGVDWLVGAEQGHSTPVGADMEDIHEEIPRDEFPHYVIHVTTPEACDGIAKRGLIPGGRTAPGGKGTAKGGKKGKATRNEVHMVAFDGGPQDCPEARDIQGLRRDARLRS